MGGGNWIADGPGSALRTRSGKLATAPPFPSPALSDPGLAAAATVWNYVGEILFNMLGRRYQDERPVHPGADGLG